MSTATQGTTNHPDHRTMALLWATLALILAWLFAAASLIQIEYSDGLGSILNARYILGSSDHWFAQRAPFYPLLLTPAELLSGLLHLERFDLRPYHLWMALLHGGYLILCLQLLRRHLDVPTKALAIGFLAAIPNVVFLSYAPFVNHDLLGGLLLLAMLILAERFVQAREDDWPTLGIMLLLGTIAATMKVTFALVWVLVILTRLLPYLPGIKLQRTAPARLGLLFATATLSALLTWLSYAWALTGWDPDLPFWYRPYGHYLAITQHFADYQAPYWWSYFPNLLLGYGATTSLLLLPGIWLALRSGDRLRQGVALAVVLGFLVLLVTLFREVRYLAFLVPAFAFLIIPVIARLLERRPGRLIVLGLLLVDLSRGVWTAIHPFQPFYTQSAESRFLSVIEPMPPVTILSRALSFRAPQPSPFLNDPYNRVFHLTGAILQRLYSWPPGRVIALDEQGYELPTPLAHPEQFGEGAVLLFANLYVMNATRADLPQEEDNQAFLQFSAVVTTVPYIVGAAGYRAEGVEDVIQFVFPDEGGALQLKPLPTTLTIEQADQIPGFMESPRLWGYRIKQLCKLDGCREVGR